MTKQELIAFVETKVYQNNTGNITGQALQDSLLAIIEDAFNTKTVADAAVLGNQLKLFYTDNTTESFNIVFPNAVENKSSTSGVTTISDTSQVNIATERGGSLALNTPEGTTSISAEDISAFVMNSFTASSYNNNTIWADTLGAGLIGKNIDINSNNYGKVNIGILNTEEVKIGEAITFTDLDTESPSVSLHPSIIAALKVELGIGMGSFN